MPTASAAFHEAIRSPNPDERVLIFFGTQPGLGRPRLEDLQMIWTDSDISANAGMTFTEDVSTGADITIGETPSSTLNLSVFVDNGYLEDYLSTIGSTDCTAFLGVKTATQNSYADTPSNNSLTWVNCDNVFVVGSQVSPYLYIGDNAISVVPFPVHSVVAEYEDAEKRYLLVYCFGAEPGQAYLIYYDCVLGAVDSDLSGPAQDLTSFMLNYRIPQIAASKRSFYLDGYTIIEYKPRQAILSAIFLEVNTYEYYPLGVFNFNAPKTTDKYLMRLEAYDRMVQFDEPLNSPQIATLGEPSFWETITFPCTLSELYGEVGFWYGYYPTNPQDLYNGSMQITSKPDVPDDITGRKLLGYIAEAACSCIRFDRDGNLTAVWYNYDTAQSIYKEMQFGSTIANYVCKPITAVSITVPQSDGDNITCTIKDSGTLDMDLNVYQLSDNPLLHGTSEAAIKNKITPIYNRLHGMTQIKPISINCVGDWSVKAGDMCWFQNEDFTYAAVRIDTITQTFRGLCVGTIVSRGNPMRSGSGGSYLNKTARASMCERTMRMNKIHETK